MAYSGVMSLCSSEVSIEAVESPAFSSRNPSPRLWGGEFLSMPAESRDNLFIKKIWNYAFMWSISMHFCPRLHILPFSLEIVDWGISLSLSGSSPLFIRPIPLPPNLPSWAAQPSQTPRFSFHLRFWFKGLKRPSCWISGVKQMQRNTNNTVIATVVMLKIQI